MLVLQSKKKERSFTIEIRGEKDVAPVGAGSAPHPYFMVDGRFLQVLSVALEEFKGVATASDETLLKQHLKYEAEFHKLPMEVFRDADSLKLPVAASRGEKGKATAGRPALSWSFTVPSSDKKQVFLTFREKGYVVVLGSAVEAPDTKAAVEEFLRQTAVTFRAYDGPVVLKFSPDGRYEPK